MTHFVRLLMALPRGHFTAALARTIGYFPSAGTNSVGRGGLSSQERKATAAQKAADTISSQARARQASQFVVIGPRS
jgi:hypothetical protein